MITSIRVIKTGRDHVERQVDDEAAADVVADEANKRDISPVIGQRRGQEMTRQHYVVLHGVVRDILTFLEENPRFKIVDASLPRDSGLTETTVMSVQLRP